MSSFVFLSRRLLRNNTKRAFSTAPKDTANSTSTGFSWLLENHGGKVGLAAIAVGGGFIWSYFEGGSQRSKLENTIEQNFLLEPYETLLARYSNKFPLEKLNEIIFNEFHDDILGNRFIYYENFVSRLESKCGLKLNNTYLLDRALASYIERAERIEKEIEDLRKSPQVSPFSTIFYSPTYPTGLKLQNNFQYVSNYNKDGNRNIKNLSFDVIFLISLLSHFTELIPVSDDKEKLKVIERANSFIKMIKLKEGSHDASLTKGKSLVSA